MATCDPAQAPLASPAPQRLQTCSRVRNNLGIGLQVYWGFIERIVASGASLNFFSPERRVSEEFGIITAVGSGNGASSGGKSQKPVYG